jgi:hypothetical protein
MATANELRAEAARMREFALTVTDPEVLAEINLMIAEWERRAREMSNGGGAAVAGEGERADACQRLAKTAVLAETRETMLYLGTRWRRFAADDEAGRNSTQPMALRRLSYVPKQHVCVSSRESRPVLRPLRCSSRSTPWPLNSSGAREKWERVPP